MGFEATSFRFSVPCGSGRTRGQYVKCVIVAYWPTWCEASGNLWNSSPLVCASPVCSTVNCKRDFWNGITLELPPLNVIHIQHFFEEMWVDYAHLCHNQLITLLGPAVSLTGWPPNWDGKCFHRKRRSRTGGGGTCTEGWAKTDSRLVISRKMSAASSDQSGFRQPRLVTCLQSINKTSFLSLVFPGPSIRMVQCCWGQIFCG